MTATAPRVEVEVQALGTVYLSNDPPFYLVIHSGLWNSEEQVIFLQDGFAGASGYQPINSDQVIQCFDNETGEQVQVLHQGTQPVFLDRHYIQYTTCNTRQSYELPFITSSLRPGRKYRLRFKPTTSISHWPASAENALNSLASAPSGSVSASDIPPPSRQSIPWEAADGNDTIIFETRSSRPRTPNVTVSLSAPSTYSLSKPFTFTLTFSTDAAYPFTVRAHRARVEFEYSDVKILDATSRLQLAPDLIDICRDPDEHQREEFLTLEGTYTEHRELDFKSPFLKELELQVGQEYILSHLGGKWWWTEDTVDEIMDYLGSWSSIGLARGEEIEFAGAGDVKFKVVE